MYPSIHLPTHPSTHSNLLPPSPTPPGGRVPGSAASERARRLQKALILAEDIDDERRVEKRREALERRKEMERERRKAVKAAYARQREAKKKTVNVTSAVSFWGRESLWEGAGRGGVSVPTGQRMRFNVPVALSAFRDGSHRSWNSRKSQSP